MPGPGRCPRMAPHPAILAAVHFGEVQAASAMAPDTETIAPEHVGCTAHALRGGGSAPSMGGGRPERYLGFMASYMPP